MFGHVSGLGASLFLVKLLWQRRKLLNWLGIGLRETGSCNNVKVVKPLGHLLQPHREKDRGESSGGGGGGGAKEPENDREWRDLFQCGVEQMTKV